MNSFLTAEEEQFCELAENYRYGTTPDPTYGDGEEGDDNENSE